MIIGISGKIGSGKDTIGYIIMHLIARSKGFSTSNWPEKESYDSLKGKSSWEIKKFADKLKEVCSILTGIPKEDFEKQEVKDMLLGEEWAKNPRFSPIKNPTIGGTDTVEYVRDMPTVRWLLQIVGTEAMRNNIHQDVWVNALFADYRLIDTKLPIEVGKWAYCKNNGQARFVSSIYQKGTGKDKVFCDDGLVSKESASPYCYIDQYNKGEFPNWIITDMRFPNELKAIKDRKGITIRISRNQYFSIEDLKDPNYVKKHEHPSETVLDNATFDYTIDNNSTIEELVEKVKEILIKEKIL